MPTTIHIQGQFSHGLIPMWILFIIIISPLIAHLYKKRKAKKLEKKNKKTAETTTQTVPVTVSVRESYVNKVELLRREYNSSKRNERDTYQLLSLYIKEFVLELTGIDITKKTLAEIRAHELPEIERLIEEYYAYEFAPDTTGNVNEAIDKAVQVIKKWN